jgi:hypothetical protein
VGLKDATASPASDLKALKESITPIKIQGCAAARSLTKPGILDPPMPLSRTRSKISPPRASHQSSSGITLVPVWKDLRASLIMPATLILQLLLSAYATRDFNLTARHLHSRSIWHEPNHISRSHSDNPSPHAPRLPLSAL